MGGSITLIEKDHLGDWSPEKDYCLRLTFRPQVVETSVANNSPSQDSNHPDDLFQIILSRYVTPGFKPFS